MNSFCVQMKIEEKILFNEIKNRNRKVFDALFREYYPVLTRFAESFVFDRSISEDLVQSFFVSLWVNAPDMDIKDSLKQYCFRSVRNLCMNRLRDLKVRDKRQLLYLEAVLKQDDTSDWVDPDVLVQIKESIDQLPPKMALIFKLKYLEEKKNKEISGLLNLSENTIKTQLSRARDKIRTMLLKTTSLCFFI